MKRILFVDDERSVLEGLRRMLCSRQATWEMAFFASPDEALAAMDERSFDVIVTDMRMPQMSGSELLTVVQARHPEVVRIVLSGHADLESSMRSVAVSQPFLTKPCSPEVPYPVVEAVAHHHHPTRVPQQALFDVPGATHVANTPALEQEGLSKDLICLDEEYLEAHGVLGLLPEWRSIATEAADAQEQAA